MTSAALWVLLAPLCCFGGRFGPRPLRARVGAAWRFVGPRRFLLVRLGDCVLPSIAVFLQLWIGSLGLGKLLGVGVVLRVFS